MPKSAAPFISRTIVGHFIATIASLVSGAATAVATALGNYGLSIPASATVKMQFPIPGLGQLESERLPPYEQYNTPISTDIRQNFLTVYYSVAAVALTSASIGLYATSRSATGAVVTVLLAQTALPTAIGTYAAQIPLKNLPAVPVPNTLVVAELDIATASGGTSIVNGISVS